MKRDRQSVSQRQAEMLALIRKRQQVMVDELSEIFSISTMTVRRDLQLLEEQGKISRFHGGASMDARQNADGREDVSAYRRAIARCAAAQVTDGDTLLINGSSTALSMLNYVGQKRVTAFTNNCMVVRQSWPAGVTIRLSGGTYHGTHPILTGDLAMRNLMEVYAKKAFLGCTGISQRGEIVCGIPSELGLNETMIEHADAYYILADYTKIGRSSTYASFHLEKRGCVITDELAPEDVLQRLRDQGMQVIRARREDFPDEPNQE